MPESELTLRIRAETERLLDEYLQKFTKLPPYGPSDTELTQSKYNELLRVAIDRGTPLTEDDLPNMPPSLTA